MIRMRKFRGLVKEIKREGKEREIDMFNRSLKLRVKGEW